jgi:hypothetical protein
VTGNLALTINGLGTTGSAAVTVSGPGSYNRAVGKTTTLTGLNPGSYLITASNASAAGGTTHTPNPTTQTVSVIARNTSNATVDYSPPPNNGSYNLHVAGFYVTQSAQSYGGAIPLVANRPGLLRVFVVSDEANTPAPVVRARIFNSLGVQVDSADMLPQGSFAPTAVDESSLSFSWNLALSKARIQTGMGIQIVVDPGNLITETSKTDNVYPASLPQTMTVRTIPVVNLSFVPILQNGRQGNTSNTDTLLSFTRRMHPLDSINVAVRSPFVTSRVLQADGTGWTDVLNELDVARLNAADGRYWYGVANVAYGAGVAGIAYVSPGTSNPQKTAMGWDYLPTGSIVAAHELGHNWTRNHAPCGNPANVDPQYPQADGSTAGYGWDRSNGALQPASSKDIMGYCDPRWISDYTYSAVLNYLSTGPIVMSQAAMSQAALSVQPCLLVWGHIRDGEMVLEPAFQVNTRPSLPDRSGPYSIEAQAHDGSALFSYSFAPHEVADAQQTQQNFAFAIPLPATQAAQLSTLRLTGGGRPAVTQAEAVVQPDSVQLRQVGGRLALRWNARAKPMVMVRDRQTGEVLSLARGGSVELPDSKRQVDLLFSNGVKSQLKRIRVTR